MSADLSIIGKTREQLRELGQTRGPIIVGPWLSEVGFELLYWIPFLRWAVKFAGLNADDLVIVSRGGAASWYQDISTRYLDVLDFYTPEEFRAADVARIHAQAERYVELGLKKPTKSPKQQMVAEFDEAIIARVCDRAGLTNPRLLHPSMLFRLFRPFWRGHKANLHQQMATARRLHAPDSVPALPSSYVAMKFYTSAAMPDTPTTRRLVQQLVRAVAQTTDVVLLHREHSVDDHHDFPVDAHPRVHRVAMPPAHNLDIQTAIIARASSFVGTYGGFAYLAPFLGVPTVALYARENFRRDHRNLMAQTAKALRVPFVVDALDHGHTHLQVRHAA